MNDQDPVRIFNIAERDNGHQLSHERTMMTTYTVGTGFSGIGVPDLCARLLGMRTLWQIENNKFCQQILRKNFPEVETLYEDIHDVSQPVYTDLQVYGFPCQPFSISGLQRGEKDERYLVPEMLRVIDETRPRVVLLENVPRFASLDDGYSFKNLLQALAQMGFDAEWGHLRASDTGAPHERERWFCVAYASQFGRQQRRDTGGNHQRLGSSEWAELRPEFASGNVAMAYTGGERNRTGTTTINQCIPDKSGFRPKTEPRRHNLESRFESHGRSMGDARRPRLEGQRRTRRISTQLPCADAACGVSARANTGEIKPRLGRVIDGVADWMDGFAAYPARPGMAQFAFEPPRITSVTDTRAGRLKALGNTMAVDVIFEIMLSIRTWLEAVDAQVEGIAA